MKWLKWVSMGLTVLGAIVGIGSAWVDDKKTDAMLDEKVNKKFSEISKEKES